MFEAIWAMGAVLMMVGLIGLIVRRGPRGLWWISLLFGVVLIGTGFLLALYIVSSVGS